MVVTDVKEIGIAMATEMIVGMTATGEMATTVMGIMAMVGTITVNMQL